MPIVDIKGIGEAQFPDDMPIDNIRQFLRAKYAQDVVNNRPLQLQPAPDTVEPFRPSLSQRLGQGVADTLINTGLVSDRGGAQRIGRNVTALGEFLPGVGDATAGDEFGRAVAKGDQFGMALGALGVIPVAGDVAKAGAKKLSESIVKYHGSSSRFNKPTLEKYGEGEGGLGFGYGFHTTDSPDTALNYAQDSSVIEVGGELFTGETRENFIGREIIADGYDNTLQEALDFVKSAPERAYPKELLSLVQSMKGKTVRNLSEKGVVYDVNINRKDIESYMNFEDPIKDQPGAVKDILREAGLSDNQNITGGDLYYDIADSVGGDKEASEFLDSVGIKGLKYNDDIANHFYDVQKGNFNFTVFNPEGVSVAIKQTKAK